MELGVHLPLMRFGDEPLTPGRVRAAVGRGPAGGFAAVSANDHLVFQTPWLDGPSALASVIERSGDLELATTIALPVLRGPIALAKTLSGIDLLSEGRLAAGVGPGSSQRDYDLVGIPFDGALETVRRGARAPARAAARQAAAAGPALLSRAARPRAGAAAVQRARDPAVDRQLGLPRGAGAGRPWGDGWLASAYNTTPDLFAAGRAALSEALAERGREAGGFPTALSTTWTWVTEDRADADRVLRDVLAPMLRRDVDGLRHQVCVGSAEHCIEALSNYARAGCGRAYLWPLGDEARQLELIAGTVAPHIDDAGG